MPHKKIPVSRLVAALIKKHRLGHMSVVAAETSTLARIITITRMNANAMASTNMNMVTVMARDPTANAVARVKEKENAAVINFLMRRRKAHKQSTHHIGGSNKVLTF
jgi:hypothetical protein